MSHPLEIFTLKEVVKHYPILGGIFKRKVGQVRVINGINFAIARGEITGLVGESGCGKSTLAKLLIKLEESTSGTILFNDRPLDLIKGAEKKQFYRHVQMIFQDPLSSLNPRMKVKDIVGEMVRIQGVGKEVEKEKVLRILQEVELDVDAINRYPHEFSGGQRQRIAIARALIVEPQLLIADEPVSALDLSLQAKTLTLLQSLKKRYNLTILLISHDLKKVADFCDSVAVMYLGRIVEMLPADKLLSQCRHPYTKALISSIPITDPSQRKKKKAVIRGEVPSPIDLPPGCAFHQRCPKRFEKCDLVVPELKTTPGEDHQLACFLQQ
ncbi:ABC transporter ATP-binding protein [bacterium]|nr:ABC transporter ATP-binding protein [bacterium]